MTLMGRVKKGISLSMVFLMLVSCISTHRYAPVGEAVSGPPVKRYDLLTFNMVGSVPPGFKGGVAVQKAMGKSAPFINVSESSEISPRGVHCRVELIPSQPGKVASLFGYLSFFTLFAVPSLSLKEGYEVRYHLYVNGEHQKTVYAYRIKRRSGIWIALTPLIWMNLLTRTEEEVVENTVLEFFGAVEPILNSVDENRIGDRF